MYVLRSSFKKMTAKGYFTEQNIYGRSFEYFHHTDAMEKLTQISGSINKSHYNNANKFPSQAVKMRTEWCNRKRKADYPTEYKNTNKEMKRSSKIPCREKVGLREDGLSKKLGIAMIPIGNIDEIGMTAGYFKWYTIREECDAEYGNGIGSSFNAL